MIKVTKLGDPIGYDAMKKALMEEDESLRRVRYEVNIDGLCITINAQDLIDSSRKKLCVELKDQILGEAHELKDAVYLVDSTMAHAMVPECYYRGGMCPYQNPKGCQENMMFLKQMISVVPEAFYRDARNEAAGKLIGE